MQWTIDPVRSRVTFAVRHLVFSKVRGRFTRFRGSLTVEGNDWLCTRIMASIEVASVETGDRERDEYLRTSEFLDPAHFPTLEFASKRVERDGRRLRVVGDLSIRGQTREVALAVDEKSRGLGERVSFHAETKIDRRDYDLRWGALVETGGFMVGDQIEIALDVEATRPPTS